MADRSVLKRDVANQTQMDSIQLTVRSLPVTVDGWREFMQNLLTTIPSSPAIDGFPERVTVPVVKTSVVLAAKLLSYNNPTRRQPHQHHYRQPRPQTGNECPPPSPHHRGRLHQALWWQHRHLTPPSSHRHEPGRQAPGSSASTMTNWSWSSFEETRPGGRTGTGTRWAWPPTGTEVSVY